MKFIDAGEVSSENRPITLLRIGDETPRGKIRSCSAKGEYWMYAQMLMLSRRYRWTICRRSQLLSTIALVVMLHAVNVTPSYAAVTATGDVVPIPLTANQSVNVGIDGFGTMRIDNGSTFQTSQVRVGIEESGVGTVTVTGAGSKWTTEDSDIGQRGVGRLEILEGGVVETIIGGGSVEIGSNSTGQGTTVVTGKGSLYQIHGSLSVGLRGTGVLRIADDAIVNVIGNSTSVSHSSRVELNGGLLRTPVFQNSGVVSGSGIIFTTDGNADNINRGRIEARQGNHLQISRGIWENRGELVADGGELEINSALVNGSEQGPEGRATLRNGTLRVGVIGGGEQDEPQLTNRDLIASIDGTNHIHGIVRNDPSGQIAITNESLLMFHDNVLARQDSTISVFAGSTAIFLQDLTLNGGTLLADLTGAAGFGHAEVVGDFTFNGALEVSLSDGYVPTAGDSFPLLTVAGEIRGEPQLLAPQPLSEGLDWRLQVGANQVVASVVVDTIDGDFNGNGTVDAADYTVWRDMLGQQGSALAADGSGPIGLPDGVVDDHDYDFWKSNFGATAGTAGAAAASDSLSAVPEPSTWMLSLLGLLVVGRRAVLRR